MGGRTPYGAQRLKARVLEIIDNRIKACRASEERYAAMAADGGGILGSAELAKISEATERTARMEVEHLRTLIDQIQAAGKPPARPQGSG